jgi:hypothetical protein
MTDASTLAAPAPYSATRSEWLGLGVFAFRYLRNVKPAGH